MSTAVSPRTGGFISASLEGHDWCIIQMGVPGRVWGVDVDTSFFTGNHPPRVSIQGACLGSFSRLLCLLLSPQPRCSRLQTPHRTPS